MADIGLRFYKDMLVLSAPVLPALERRGCNVAHDIEFTMLIEPDTFEDVYRLEAIAGAQCFVTSTATITPARLTQVGMEDRAEDLAKNAIEVLKPFNPQHILVEIGPCGLPLDGSSQPSLKENLDQYARAGRLFIDKEFDAFFLNGFATCTDLKCALMGLRKVSDRPIFASVDVRADGMLVCGRETLEQAFAVMEEYGAQVAGFATGAAQDDAQMLAARAAACTNLALLVQLAIPDSDERHQAGIQDVPYASADTMADAAEALYVQGVQFLRATGYATPAYTGALVATVDGLDVYGFSEDPTFGLPEQNEASEMRTIPVTSTENITIVANSDAVTTADVADIITFDISDIETIDESSSKSSAIDRDDRDEEIAALAERVRKRVEEAMDGQISFDDLDESTLDEE